MAKRKQRTCPACHQHPIMKNSQMCGICSHHYGTNPNLWPEWLSFLLSSYEEERANDLRQLRQRE